MDKREGPPKGCGGAEAGEGSYGGTTGEGPEAGRQHARRSVMLGEAGEPGMRRPGQGGRGRRRGVEQWRRACGGGGQRGCQTGPETEW